MQKKILTYPLGMILKGGKVFLFLRVNEGRSCHIQIVSVFAERFKVFAEKIIISKVIGREKNFTKYSDFRFSKLKDKDYFLTYKVILGKKSRLKGVLSKDLIHWKKPRELPFAKGEIGVIVSNYKWKDKYAMYFGEKQIRLALSGNLKKWEVIKDFVLKPRRGYFNSSSLQVINPVLIKEGILLVYFVKKSLSLGAALFSRKDPSKLLWRSANPLWQATEKILPLSVVESKRNLIFYCGSKKGEVGKITFSIERIFGKESPRSVLEKVKENPIIKPIAEHSWESQYVFNPAAVYLDGRVHLVYRAIGEKGISVLGYAASKDGIHIDERLDRPCYIPQEPFESPGKKPSAVSYNFMSGGGFGGCEDPRITRLNSRLYMTYTAFNGIPRVALTSIRVDDFLGKRWNWEKPVLISPPHEVHKNWVIFPEKIKGRYVILHSISPNILVDYFDSLDFDGQTYIKSYYSPEGRKGYWDSKIRGVGAPPIKTKDGWLIFYHAINDRDPGRYKIGAMILDYNDPAKILYRSAKPILIPDEHYENEGFKSGVVYVCGAVVMNKHLFIYYGGADTVICVATADLNEFLEQLKSSGPIKMQSFIVSPATPKLNQQYV